MERFHTADSHLCYLIIVQDRKTSDDLEKRRGKGRGRVILRDEHQQRTWGEGRLEEFEGKMRETRNLPWCDVVLISTSLTSETVADYSLVALYWWSVGYVPV